MLQKTLSFLPLKITLFIFLLRKALKFSGTAQGIITGKLLFFNVLIVI